MPTLSKNLSFLHAGEEDLRVKSIAIVEANTEMSRHLSMIETCLDLLQHLSANDGVKALCGEFWGAGVLHCELCIQAHINCFCFGRADHFR